MSNFFEKHRKEIMKGLESKELGLTGPLTLVEGLVFLDIQNDPNTISIGGGNRIPMIVVVENNTGRIHQFALKIICPNLIF